MIVDGRALALRRKEEVLRIRKTFGPLSLGLVVSSQDAVTNSFIKIKKRVATELDIGVIEYASVAESAVSDGVILQLPLPPEMNTDEERNKIPFEKDVDVLSDRAYEAFVRGDFPPPPVPRAMEYILHSEDISIAGKQVVVIGQGRLVGKPAAELFRQRGGVVTAFQKGDDIHTATLNADIVVLGAGEPHMLKPHMVKDGVIILDAGTSEASGRVVGDADPECAKKASLFTPVPGGIGPLAVVEIFANLLALRA